MGNQTCKDTQDITTMLANDIRNHKGRDFENLLKSQHVTLPYDMSEMSLWQLLVLYSSEYDLVQMENICKHIMSHHKMFGSINKYRKYHILDPLYSHIQYMYSLNDIVKFNHQKIVCIPSRKVRSNDLDLEIYNCHNKKISGKCNFNDPIFVEYEKKIIINHNNISPIILALRIKEFVFKKFKLDIKVIDLLIKTLKHIYYLKQQEKDYYFKTEGHANVIKSHVPQADMYEISKYIEEIKLNALENILSIYNGHIYEIHEVDEPCKTIWHMLVTATLTYTIEEIKILTTLVNKYCSHLNLNKLASTTKSVTIIYKENVIGQSSVREYVGIDNVTTTGTFYDRELQMLKPCIHQKEIFNPSIDMRYVSFELNELRPITIGFNIKRKIHHMLDQIEKDKVIDHIIDNLITINQSLKTFY